MIKEDIEKCNPDSKYCIIVLCIASEISAVQLLSGVWLWWDVVRFHNYVSDFTIIFQLDNDTHQHLPFVNRDPPWSQHRR